MLCVQSRVGIIVGPTARGVRVGADKGERVGGRGVWGVGSFRAGAAHTHMDRMLIFPECLTVIFFCLSFNGSCFFCLFCQAASSKAATRGIVTLASLVVKAPTLFSSISKKPIFCNTTQGLLVSIILNLNFQTCSLVADGRSQFFPKKSMNDLPKYGSE
jgi:hypothetical protein